jgi:hypothetical protein
MQVMDLLKAMQIGTLKEAGRVEQTTGPYARASDRRVASPKHCATLDKREHATQHVAVTPYL